MLRILTRVDYTKNRNTILYDDLINTEWESTNKCAMNDFINRTVLVRILFYSSKRLFNA